MHMLHALKLVELKNSHQSGRAGVALRGVGRAHVQAIALVDNAGLACALAVRLAARRAHVARAAGGAHSAGSRVAVVARVADIGTMSQINGIGVRKT